MIGFLAWPKKESRQSDLETIKRAVSRYFDIATRTLISKRRKADIAHARQIGMYLACVKTNFSLVEIGKCFNRSHATVLYSYYKIQEIRESDSGTKFQLLDLDNYI